jgi:hypothetical protein
MLALAAKRTVEELLALPVMLVVYHAPTSLFVQTS